MEARPGYLTAVNLHRVKYCNRCNLTAASCLPLNRPEDRFIGVILKFEGNAVIVMVSGPAEACGIGKAVIPQHHPVDGDVRNRKFCIQHLEGADAKTIFHKTKELSIAAVLQTGKFVQSFQDMKAKKLISRSLQTAASRPRMEPEARFRAFDKACRRCRPACSSRRSKVLFVDKSFSGDFTRCPCKGWSWAHSGRQRHCV